MNMAITIEMHLLKKKLDFLPPLDVNLNNFQQLKERNF